MASEDVVARLRVDGEGPFAQAFGRARDAIRGTTSEAETSERGMAGAAKALVGAAGAAVVARKGYQGLKDAVNTTADLAKSTAAFSRASGLSTKESQAWITVAKSRGIETQQLQMGMAAFGRQLGSTDAEGQATSKALQQLGIDQAALIKQPMAERMATVADAFAKLPDGPEKAAAAQRIFGRSGQALLPILNAGSAGLQEQLDTANRLVPPLGKTADESLKLAKQQREMQMALTGVKTTIGAALIPILGSLLKAFSPILQAFTTALNKVPGLSAVIVTLGTAFAGLIVINKVLGLLQAFGLVQSTTTIATLAQAVATKIAAAAQWALNAALYANPIGLIVIAILAFAAAIVAAYLKVGWFRDLVNAAFAAIQTAISAVFNWVKANWPLLLSMLAGPFGPAAVLIIKNFDKIKQGVSNAFNAIKQAALDTVNAIINFFRQLPSAIGNFIGSLGSSIGETLKNAVKSILPGPLQRLLGTGGIIAAQTGFVGLGGGRNVLVGERGPEMLSLPSGSRVTPLPPPSLTPTQLGQSDRPVIAQVFLDRRMIAQALASYAAEQQAAR